MEIKYPNRDVKELKQMQPGTVFLSGSTLFMRCISTTNGLINTVNLTTGEIIAMESTSQRQPIKGYFQVE